MACDGIHDQVAIARLKSRLERRGGAVVVRMRHAALLARAAIVAGMATVVRLGKDRAATDGCDPSHAGAQPIAKELFAAAKRHRRHEDAVRELVKAFGDATEPDVAFDLFVVRNQVGVLDPPVLAIAIAIGAAEVDVAHTIRLAAPRQGASAKHAHPDPVERAIARRLVGIPDIVSEPFVVRLAARIHQPLDRAVAH